MVGLIKKLIFKQLGVRNYLKLLQDGFFVSYNSQLLRLSKNYSYHYFVKKLIHQGDVILDIGANLGYYSIHFAKWTGKTGKVIAVEPILIYNEIFNRYAKKCGNITLYPYALGTEEGTIQMVTSSQKGYLSTGLPHVYDPEKDGKLEDQDFRFEVQMKIPAFLFASLDQLDYIKCDVEGYEYIVLANMKEIIKKHKPIIQVEVWGENEKNIKELLKNLDYIPFKLHKNRLESDESIINKINGDFIFMHPAKIR